MNSKGFYVILAAVAAAYLGTTYVHAKDASGTLSKKERLGKLLFFDRDLSDPEGQSCATCHGPKVGFTGPDSTVNIETSIYPGAFEGRFGNRKPPAAAYVGDSPILDYDEMERAWVGGVFWDGRATGWNLGDPLAEQAQGPFLNPLEQNVLDAQALCRKVAGSRYARFFMRVWNLNEIDCDGKVDEVYEQIARSIAAYERSVEVNPFSSKYDDYLAGKVTLTEQEQLGLELFEGAAQCAACHPSEPRTDGAPPLFTDFTFDNLGFPKNPENPFYKMPEEWNPAGEEWVDEGLGGFLKSEGFPLDVYAPEIGKHKVPTLRNVDRRPSRGFVKAFGHNGIFKSLEQVVHFYNTRDVEGAGWMGEPWPDAEISDNVNIDELGNLGLTAEEEDAIVAFLKTLSDGYKICRN